MILNLVYTKPGLHGFEKIPDIRYKRIITEYQELLALFKFRKQRCSTRINMSVTSSQLLG